MAYDISNYAYVVGDAMPDIKADATPHAVHLVQDVTQGQNRDRILRVLDSAFRQLQGLLMPFLCEEEPEKNPYTIYLRVPPSVTQAHLDLWSILAYEYMVTAALADWLGICAPTMAQVWADRRDANKQRLAQSVKIHHRRARRPLSPF